MDTKFNEYLSFEKSLHPKIMELPFPTIDNFENLILYGPPGIGKYTLMLSIIKRYSTLKCDSRLHIETIIPFYIRISDIHYEVDMDFLGCNSKHIWNDIHSHILDVIQNKHEDKRGIIVCKNFHKIKPELLDIFYSYMQDSVKYILLTESVSFIPANILSKCHILSVPRPSRDAYENCLNVPIPTVINNIKSVQLRQPTLEFSANMCKLLIDVITTLKFTMSDLREELYKILIFNMSIENICHVLLKTLGKTPKDKFDMVKETVQFLQYYNNNYRPIYHMEHYIYSLMRIEHGLNI